VTLSSTATKHKPALDENSFQQLLAAAYVVQHHNEGLRAKDSQPGTSQVLAVIAEIQSRIRTQGLDVPASTVLIADRLLRLVEATGVSISLITEGFLDCVAEAGVPAKVPGSCVSSHSLVATERLKLGGVFDSENSQSDMRLDVELCRRVGVGSLIAAPLHRFGEIAGLIEVRWKQAGGFKDVDLRTCRLIAGLITGTLERNIRVGNARSAVAKEAPASADVTALTSMEEEVEAQAGGAIELSQGRLDQSGAETRTEAITDSNATAPVPSLCRICGRPFATDEAFCGFCSMPKPIGAIENGLQSKWASLWFMQRAQGSLREGPADSVHVPAIAATEELEDLSVPRVDVMAPSEPSALTRILQAGTQSNAYTGIETFRGYDVPEAETPFPFSDGPPIQDRVARFARRRWRDFLLAIVALSLAYGLKTAWPKSHSQLTWFQSLMVEAGLMHAPDRNAVFAGAPDVRVWLDVHTQLYYCEGTDLYGKTPDGEFTTQHNAQSDGYQSASNATCP
jgi:hypothetical protein